jgi:leader peptidase (prepilin peptidase)/N-methyltransferase
VEPVLAFTFFAFGLAFGSFLNVCIYRIPIAIMASPDRESPWREMLDSFAAWRSVSRPKRSFCPSCGHGIRSYDNLPVVSWFLLGGRCRDCRSPISFRYAAVELLTGLVFLACYARFGLSLAALKFCVFAFLLFALIFTDAEHKLLPDAYTIPGLLIGLLLSFFVPVNDVATRWISGMPWQVVSLLDAVLGSLIGAAFIFGSGLIYKLARGAEGMGLGDVKLMAMVGAFLGLRLTVLTIFGASILGSVFALFLVPLIWYQRTQRRMIRLREPAALARRRAWQSAQLIRYYALPFGVFLGAVALFAAFFGSELLRWYWNRIV